MSESSIVTYILRQKLAVVIFAAALWGCAAPESDVAGSKDVIVASDPRFDVFELPNSAGDGTFASPEGVIYLSFAARDSRYCRAARFPADNNAVLACRIQSGWQIEAESEFASSGNMNTLGNGRVTPAINEAIAALNPTAEFLDERDVIDAASKGWR